MKLENLKDIKKIVVHGNCPDGMASAILLKDTLPDAEVFFATHNTVEYETLEATEGMIFCDITPPMSRIDEFAEAGAIVLDHHKKFNDVVHKFGDRGVFADENDDPGVSGAVLAFNEVWLPYWSHVYEPTHERIVGARYFATLAGIRDTCVTDSIYWDKAGAQAAVLTFLPWEHWAEQMGTNFLFEEDMELGKKLYTRRMRLAHRCAEKAVRFEYGKFKVAVFADPDKLTSDASEILISKGINIIAGFNFTSTDNVPIITFSLRSDGTIDVADLAASFPGGGGHTLSAGFARPMAVGDANPFTYFIDVFEDYVSYGSDFIRKKLEYA